MSVITIALHGSQPAKIPTKVHEQITVTHDKKDVDTIIDFFVSAKQNAEQMGYEPRHTFSIALEEETNNPHKRRKVGAVTGEYNPTFHEGRIGPLKIYQPADEGFGHGSNLLKDGIIKLYITFPCNEYPKETAAAPAHSPANKLDYASVKLL